MHRGWVKLWRKSIESDAFTDHLWRLFSYCIFRANHKPSKVFVARLADPVEVGIGQFITGRFALHAEMYPKQRKTDPSPNTVWRRLVILKNLGNLGIETHSRFTIITVCEYETYNIQDFESGQNNGQQVGSRWAAGGQQAGNRVEKKESHNKERKEPKKNVKNKRGRARTLDLESIDYPDGMDTAVVRTAITVWLDYKKARGETYKDPAVQIGILLANSIFGGDPAAFVAAVDNSRANNWAGCFPPKGFVNGNQTPAPGQAVRRSGRVHQRDWSPDSGQSQAGPGRDDEADNSSDA